MYPFLALATLLLQACSWSVADNPLSLKNGLSPSRCIRESLSKAVEIFPLGLVFGRVRPVHETLLDRPAPGLLVAKAEDAQR